MVRSCKRYVVPGHRDLVLLNVIWGKFAASEVCRTEMRVTLLQPRVDARRLDDDPGGPADQRRSPVMFLPVNVPLTRLMMCRMRNVSSEWPLSILNVAVSAATGTVVSAPASAAVERSS
jgi:hypothetical protein